MSDPLEAITDLLRAEHGINPNKLHPQARIAHDLGVDGDDASELLQHLQERFGTDFSALNEQWTEFFLQEGTSLRSVLCGISVMLPSTVLTGWIASEFNLPTTFAGAIGVSMFFACWAAVGRLFSGMPKRPVTIEGLADIVRAGTWPADPSKVR